MKTKLLVIALPVAFLFSACTSDSGTSPSISSSSDVPLSSVLSSSSIVVPPTVSLPASANVAYPAALYEVWKSRWLVSMATEVAGGSTMDNSIFNGYAPMRVKWDNGDASCEVTGLTTMTVALNRRTGCSVSESIGYGMLIALFQEDWTTFNGLWDYNRGARNAHVSGLMPWKLHSFSQVLSTSAALDADLDVATSLILAYYKTGLTPYLTDALVLINAIYEKGINKTNLLTYPGDTWTNKDVYNLSYFSPVAFRLFSFVDASHDWTAILNAHYAYMKAVQLAGATQALFPDWSDASGVPKDPSNGSATNSYMLFDKESVRIAWRIAWDYYWFQSTDAQEVLTRMGNFVVAQTAGAPANIPAYSYNYLTGALSTSSTSGVHYRGSYCLMGLGVNQAWLDACALDVNSYTITATGTYSGAYFREILQVMFSQLLNGEYVRPF